MQLGMIGLGRMGANMVRRLMKARPRVRRLRRDPDSVKQLAGEGATGSESMADFVGKLDEAPLGLADGAGRRRRRDARRAGPAARRRATP